MSEPVIMALICWGIPLLCITAIWLGTEWLSARQLEALARLAEACKSNVIEGGS